MTQFISGAIMTGYLIASYFFFRFYKRTRDRFFGFFSLAFVMLGLERIPLAFLSPAHENHSTIYLIRLSAFIVILGAIADKNRKTTS